MTSAAPMPQMLRPRRRVRYLKIIGGFKILQGAILLCLGISLLFLHSRTRWLDVIADWVDAESLLEHSRTVLFLLNKLQDVVTGGLLQVTGLVTLCFALLLVTEGVGVYLQQRWAELLMVFATGALIPLELRHVVLSPSLVALIILLVNCFIVWFLYRVLRRERREEVAAATALKDSVLELR